MVELSTNYLAIIVAGLIPAILGSIYYGPLFGKAWMASQGKTKEELKPNNPVLAYGGSIVLAMLLSMSLNYLIQLVHKDVNEAGELFVNTHSSFGHGALHGALIGLTILTPIIVSLGVFHKLNWKTNLFNVIFWTLCLAIMGGILDMWK
jgi:hypothetical protein